MKRYLVTFLVAVSLFFPLVTAPGSSGADGFGGESEYWDGSVYAYDTEYSDFTSTITGFTVGDRTDIRIKSAFEGFKLIRIDDNAFSGSPITSAVIPASVTSIGKNAFSGCGDLTDLYFLGDMPSMTEAFPSCVNIHYIAGTGGWDAYAEKIEFPIHSCEYQGTILKYYILNDEAVVFGHVSGVSLTIPDTVSVSGTAYAVVSIGAGAFLSNTDVTSLRLGKNIKDIGERAFYGCRNLDAVSLCDGLKAINDEAFRQCSKLGSTDGTVIIPGTTFYLGFEAFRMCNSLVTMNIPDTVTFYAEGVLRASNSLKSVKIGSGVGDLEQWSLDNCYALEDVTLPDDLKTIGDNAFTNCSSLERITIPVSVESVGANAFSGCTSLRTADFLGGLPSIGEDAFFMTADNFRVTYSPEYADSWRDYDQYPAEERIPAEDDDGNGSWMLIAVTVAAATSLTAALMYVLRRRSV